MTIAPAERGQRARVGLPSIIFLVALLIVLSSSFISAQYLARVNVVLIAIMGAASLNLLTGLAGQVSLGHAAFMAVGAYAAVVCQRAGMNELLVTLPAGAVAAGIVGLAVGIPSLRFRGFYLALTTLSLHFAVTFFTHQYQSAAGSTAGFSLPSPTLASFSISGQLRWCVLLAVLCACVLLVFHNFTRSKIGRAWVAIRDRDLAASIIGVNVVRYKLLAFVVSSSVAGFAGVLQGYVIGNVSPETFSLNVAISMIAMIIIGGMGSIVAGSVLGALVVTQLPFLIQGISDWMLGSEAGTNYAIFDIQTGMFGMVIVGFLLFEPGGLVGIARRLVERRST